MQKSPQVYPRAFRACGGGNCQLPDLTQVKGQEGMQQVLGEKGKFQDWGGEGNDLWTTRLRLGGKRRATAFAFKSGGTPGKLTPAKMGRNGDQIQRLFQSPADVFIVQSGAR